MNGRAVAGLVALLISSGTAPIADDDPAFISLFDGQSLSGWAAVATDRFTVRNGVIAYDGGTGWLRSVKSYHDFELRAEYRVVRPGSDSGIFFRAAAESAAQAPAWPVRAIQLQVTDGDSHLMLFGHGTPVKFDRKVDALKAAQKPSGEWQSIVLKVVGRRAEVSLNGALVTVSDEIALPDGHLGLQGEHGHLEWRGLAVRELPAK